MSRSFSMVLVLATLLSGVVTAANDARAFEIDDYFEIRQVVELVLSGNGQSLAYVVAAPSLETRSATRQTYVMALPRGMPKEIPALAAVRSIAWVPGKRQLAFLSDHAGPTQVFTFAVDSGSSEQVTAGAESVVQFRYAPAGRLLAFTTASRVQPPPSLLNRISAAASGILVDTNRVGLYDFVNAAWASAPTPARQLWIADGAKTSSIDIPGDVADFHWSTDSRRLSVTYAVDSGNDSLLRGRKTSVGLVDVPARTFSNFAQARELPREALRAFAGGEWVAGSRQLLLRRLTLTDPWVSTAFQEWALVDASQPYVEAHAAWRDIEVYPDAPAFFPIVATAIRVENTVEGRHSLFDMTPAGPRRSAIANGMQGSSSGFVFSDDGDAAAFINESANSPAEIYLWRKGTGARRITSLNRRKSVNTFKAMSLAWRSDDGVSAQGWLLRSTVQTRPGATIVFVHGGPCYAYPDRFAPYFSKWPYPLEVFTRHGISVFIPNYRGTCSFGRDFNSPSAIDREPVDDIVSGIHYLLGERLIDAERIGIAGHSHGAWLGSMVMTRAKKLFRASSFAEGATNYLASYQLMSGQLNREVNDIVNGVSLYDDPPHYLRLSPDLHMKDVAAATLLEAGAFSAPVLMLGMDKAARHFGVPVEFIVYPRSGHNLVEPALQRESAQRNLDWFRFWLCDEEDAAPEKREQYERWRRLR